MVWPLFSLLKSSQQAFKIHTLSSELTKRGLLPDLTGSDQQQLFKKNFLIMNALYQLQAILLPEYWLKVETLDIQLFNNYPSDQPSLLQKNNALQEYYLDWSNFTLSTKEVTSLLDSFWSRYQGYLNKANRHLDKRQALHIFELSEDASPKEIRRQWQKLALKWHPDRASGDTHKFHQVFEAWQILRKS